MNCRNCGAALGGTDANCPYCGAATGVAPRQNNYGDQYNHQQYRQQPQQAPQTNVYVQRESNYVGYHPEEHVSTWGWIGRFILLAIPILNIILMLVWGFGGSSKRSLVTWARAQLIMSILSIVIVLILYLLSMAFGWNLFQFAK